MDFLTSCTNRLCYYLSENLEYARYVNKCVTDFAMDLVAYYDDLMFKIKYNNITDKNEIMKRVCNNDEARFSGFVFFPIDINKDKIDNKYPFFIRKSKTERVEGGLPIYIEVFDNDNTFDKNGKPISRDSKGMYMPREMDEDKIVRGIEEIKDRNITIYLSAYTILDFFKESNFDEDDEDYNMELVGTLAHELQHAFDDNIVYKRSQLSMDVQSLIALDMLNDTSILLNKNSRVGVFVRSILYAISKEEMKARISEVSTIVTYMRNNGKFIRKDLIEYINNRSYEIGKSLFETFRSPNVLFKETDIADLVNAITNHYIFKKYAPINNQIDLFKEIMKYEKSENKEAYDTIFIICGYYMFKHSMLRSIEKYSPLTKDELKEFFTPNNMNNLLKGSMYKVAYNHKIREIVDFIFYNITYRLYKFFNKVFNIIFESVNEIYGIIYDGDVSFLNENDSDEFDYNRYSKFLRTHEASVYQMLGIDYCIKNNIPIL